AVTPTRPSPSDMGQAPSAPNDNSAPSVVPGSPAGQRDTSPMHETGPVEAFSTAAPPTFTGMAGRSRGNTGPLGVALPNASWSDSSLASIEDFSSVLIAMQAGKRLRQSGPMSGSMVATAPNVSTMGAGTPAQTGVPEWAAQAVADSGSMAGGATLQSEQATQQGTPGAPATAPTWAPQW